MSFTSDLARDRMRKAIYVAAGDRIDNCGGCVYSDKSRNGADYYCRAHSGPTTKGANCALQEPKAVKKWVPVRTEAI